MSKSSDNASPRLSKKEQRRQQIAQEKRNRNIKIAIPVVIVALLLLAVAFIRTNEPEMEGITQVTAAAANQHDDSLVIEFGGLPPMGGPHASVWQNCGIYNEPVLPVNAIHSMEHGAVWISYHPDLADEGVAALQAQVQGQGKLLLAPYPDLAAPVVLTAWDRQLTVDSVDDGRIAQFIDRYTSRRGPETASPCSGGVGNPVG